MRRLPVSHKAVAGASFAMLLNVVVINSPLIFLTKKALADVRTNPHKIWMLIHPAVTSRVLDVLKENKEFTLALPSECVAMWTKDGSNVIITLNQCDLNKPFYTFSMTAAEWTALHQDILGRSA